MFTSYSKEAEVSSKIYLNTGLNHDLLAVLNLKVWFHNEALDPWDEK